MEIAKAGCTDHSKSFAPLASQRCNSAAYHGAKTETRQVKTRLRAKQFSQAITD
jgi:hypothetical protein